MLNSVTATPRRARLTRDDRRRQLLGIGLAKLVDTPIHDLSVDEVAAEAGISRSLLFHYFPTKRDYHLACIAAAGRRILRTTAPDPGLSPPAQVRGMVRSFVEQIDRRRDFYLALLHGTGAGFADPGVVEVYDDIWDRSTQRVLSCLGLPASCGEVVHAWWKYVEDRALSWSGDGDRVLSLEELVDHAVAALGSLLPDGLPRGG
jgi:AcrR family transcriptional regulator